MDSINSGWAFYNCPNIDDVNNYQNKSKKKLAFVTQTTLSVNDTKEIVLSLKKKLSLRSFSSCQGGVCGTYLH